MKPIVTEEDKRLVGYLKKKKGPSNPSRVHVYYNRGAKKGGGYLTGKFYSNKNKKTYTYRSSYELRYFQMLEEDTTVVSYESETMKIPYKDFDGKYKNYIPDLMVLRSDGSIEVCEIKPEAMLDNGIVKRKAQACQSYFYKLLGKSDIKYAYKFITEKALFKDNLEYTEFLSKHSR